METIRAFIAIDLPPFAIKKIAEAQNRFKTLDLDAIWVKPQNIHLTLRFLGNITQISEITPRLLEIAGQIPKFKISLTHIGAFPNLNRPRVLWVGLKNSDRSLELLQEKIEEQIQAFGFKPETKKFTPHLTLARIKSSRGHESLKAKVHAYPNISAEEIDVLSIKLYKSQLTPKGSIYTVLESFALKN